MEAKFANRHGWSDVDPYEVIRKVSDRCLEIRAMKAEKTEEGKKRLRDSFQPGGFVGHFDNYTQEWTITSNPESPIGRIRLHKDGYWRNSGGSRFILSDRPSKFYDYNF